MSKVTVVGAGNVGATAANVIALREVADEVVMIDIKEGVSEGKAMDMMQTANLLDVNTRIKGVTNDYEATAGSDVVVITSGIPRKPGMTREELIGVNAGRTLYRDQDRRSTDCRDHGTEYLFMQSEQRGCNDSCRIK